MNLAIPIGSMYGIFTYTYYKNQLNVGKYTIHGSYGMLDGGFQTFFGGEFSTRKCGGKILDPWADISCSIFQGDVARRIPCCHMGCFQGTLWYPKMDGENFMENPMNKWMIWGVLPPLFLGLTPICERFCFCCWEDVFGSTFSS